MTLDVTPTVTWHSSQRTDSDVGIPASSLSPAKSNRPRPRVSFGLLAQRPRSSRLSACEETLLFDEFQSAKQRAAFAKESEKPDAENHTQKCVWSAHAASLRQFLIEIHFKLAVSIARQFAQAHEEIDDLVSVSCITLIRAVERFDARRGFRFSSYATRAIRSELLRYVRRQNRLRPLAVDPANLHSLPDHREAPWSTLARAETSRIVDQLVDRLEQREAYILRERYGLGTTPACRTLQALADEFSVSRERIRQVERRALKKLKRLAQTENAFWSEWKPDA